MGPGTSYDMQDGFNPFVRQVRADQGGPRAWNHGSWSGAEWMHEAAVPIWVTVNGADRDTASWLTAHQALAAAFAPVGDLAEQVEMRFTLGGQEFLMFGRPRMVQPDLLNAGFGHALTQCGFVAQDPRIYAGTASTGSTGLTQTAGGLLVPFVVPFTVDGTLSGGSLSLVNAGTEATSATLRIDGPVANPRLVIQAPDGSTSTLLVEVTLTAGQWLDIDTVAKTVLLNGLTSSNQFGRTVWGWDPYPLAAGTSTLRFFADAFESAALVTVTHRSAW